MSKKQLKICNWLSYVVISYFAQFCSIFAFNIHGGVSFRCSIHQYEVRADWILVASPIVTCWVPGSIPAECIVTWSFVKHFRSSTTSSVRKKLASKRPGQQNLDSDN